VSNFFGKEYMQNTEENPEFPVKGLIYNNSYGRRCVCLTVQRNQNKIWVPFVIDGGSPNIILGRDALIALKVNPNDIHSHLNVNIHGYDFLSAYHDSDDNRLRDINIIGWTFFRDTEVYESMDPKSKSLTLFKSYSHFLEFVKK
jgi:hypothetical protein